MRSLEQIKQTIVNDVLALRKDIRLAEGDSEYDVTVQAPANQFYRYEVLLELEDRTRNLTGFTSVINDEVFKQQVSNVLEFKQDGTAYTIADVNTLIALRLDAYVADWTTRLAGNKASGIERVYLSDNSVVSWDNSSGFTSKSGTTYLATTVVSSVTPNFDTESGLYFVDMPIQATTTGTASNASAGAITAMDPAPSSFSYCRNLASVDGGSEEETDLDLINRVDQIKVRGTNGSLGAYETLAEAQEYVDDAKALDEPNEEEGLYLGSVADIFTQFASEDSVMVEDIIYWPGLNSNSNAESFDFVLEKQPVLTNVTAIVFKYELGGTEVQVVPNAVTTDADYAQISYVSDTSTYSGSTKANDKIRLNMKLDTDTYQRKLKVLYVYDKSSETLQNVVSATDVRMVGPEPLVRKALEIPVRVIAELAISFGYVQADVETAVESNISIFFNGGTTSYGTQYDRKEIGVEIQHTDIANVILRTEGVASFDTDTFFVVNTVTGDTGDPTIIKDSQYASLLDVIFTYSTFALSNFSASFSL